MATIYTVGGNTSGGNTLVANGGCVAQKSYPSAYQRIAKIWRPKYKTGEAKEVVKIALSFVGYMEKQTCSQLEDFKANAGYGNFNMFAPHAKTATGSGVYVNGVAWCDMFVDDMFIRALGVDRAKQLLGGWSAYTPTSSNYLRNAGAYEISDFSKATFGDIIFFKNSNEGICHVEIVTTNYVAGNKNNSSTPLPRAASPTLRNGSKGEQVKILQENLNKLGFKGKDKKKLTVDGDFGKNTIYAVKKFQKKYKLTIDGVYGEKSYKKMFAKLKKV